MVDLFLDIFRTWIYQLLFAEEKEFAAHFFITKKLFLKTLL